MGTASEVMILARTRMSCGRVCVGGYDLNKARHVRLLTKDFENQSECSPYEVGEKYCIDYKAREGLVSPHVEDVGVIKWCRKEAVNRNELHSVLNRIALSHVHIKDLFGGCLTWEKSSGFLRQGERVPNGSVLVACLRHDLYLSKYSDEGKIYFYFKDGRVCFKVKYVGVCAAPDSDRIREGTFLRFSLARWWDNDGEFDSKRSYLQLSHIYD